MNDDKTPFTTYEEAKKWFYRGCAKHGKRAFTATKSYHAHYSAYKALCDANKPKPRAKKESTVGRPANLLGRF